MGRRSPRCCRVWPEEFLISPTIPSEPLPLTAALTEKTLLRNERRRVALLAVAVVMSSACGLANAPGSPVMYGHHFGDGHWPDNSRTGLRGAVAANYPGIELDINLTKDRIPVTLHDTALDKTLCTHADGSPLASDEEVYIKDHTLAELQAGYRCGGVAEPDFPDAEVVADTLLTFDEVIQAVRATPQMGLQLDFKYEPGKTLDAEAFVTEILGRWRAAGLPNPWYTSCAYPECIRALRAQGADARLTWPNFVSGSNTTLVGIGSEVLSQLGLDNPIGQALDAGATGLDASYQVLDRRTVEAARKEGLTVTLSTIDTESALSTYCQWPVDVLISNYVERSPCR